MKFPAALFSWLMVPLAAAAGFYGNRHHQRQLAQEGENGSPPAFGELQADGEAPSKTGTKFPAAAPPRVVKKWADRLRNCTAEELPRLYAEIQALKEKMAGMDGGVDHSAERSGLYYEQSTALRLLGARWAELDPQGGFAFFNQQQGEEKDTAGRQWLLAEWALRDPDAVFDTLTKQPATQSRDDLSTVGFTLMEESTEVFWNWFRKTRQPMPSEGIRDEVWQSLATQHFEELSAMAAELLEASNTPKEGQQISIYTLDSFYKLLAGTMASKDVDKALAWAREQPAAVRSQALRGALKGLVRTSPERIADYASELKPRQIGGNAFSGSGAGELIQEAVERIGEHDPLKALKWLEEKKEKLGHETYNGMSALQENLRKAITEGRLSPQDAFAAIRSSSDPNLRLNVARNMWQGLPTEQLASTAQWLLTVDSKETRSLALEGIFPEWVKQDRAAAMKFAAGVTDPALAASLYRGLASNAWNGLVNTQQERVSDALMEIPPQFRGEIMADQVRMNYDDGMMDYSPPFDGPRMAKALEGLPPSEATDKAVSRVAESWGASDPLAAMTWAAGQSDAGLREKATGAAMESWAKEDAWGASQWIDALPPGEQRDVAAHHLARVLRNDEPESAWTWAASISDPAIRLEARSAILRKWRDSGATNAQNAVNNLPADLPAPDRQKLIDTLNHKDAPK